MSPVTLSPASSTSTIIMGNEEQEEKPLDLSMYSSEGKQQFYTSAENVKKCMAILSSAMEKLGYDKKKCRYIEIGYLSDTSEDKNLGGDLRTVRLVDENF